MKRIAIVLAALGMGSAGAAYRCVDAQGKTHIGDTPPPGCAAVTMYEVTSTGKVLRTIDPTPTPEQAKAMAADAEKRKAADKAAAEQKRLDTALLSTYASEKEFDVTRDRNIEPIRTRIATAQERIKGVEKRQKEIEDEMEFYKAGKSKGKGKEMPANLTDDLKRTQSEKSAIVATIAGYEREIEQIKLKFEADKKRWLALKQPTATQAKSDPPAPADPKANVKKN
jgi:hypothetical protein